MASIPLHIAFIYKPEPPTIIAYSLCLKISSKANKAPVSNKPALYSSFILM